MTSDQRVESLLHRVAAWAAARSDVEEILLVGSYARGTADPSSDVDLILLVLDPRRLIEDPGWTSAFGAAAGAAVEEWGRVTSLRVRYGDGLEVEFGLTTVDWLSSPLDPGTRRVLEGGQRVVYRRGPDGAEGGRARSRAD